MSAPGSAADPADKRRIRVLFVAGTGRSGSTVLSNLLGSLPGLTSVGELRYLWERGIGEQALCGCGAPVPRCPFWSAVLQSAYADRPPDLAAIRAADRRFLRLRTFPELARHGGDADGLGPQAQAYAGELARVYRALAEHGAGIVVDASKLVSYAYLLRRVEGIDVYLLHLVRDPRGTAFSWSRRRTRTDRGEGSAEMGRESPVKSAVLWDVWNAAAQWCWRRTPQRYVRVRYEDFVADPAAALRPVLDLVGSPAEVPVGPDGEVAIGESHTVAGNPNRMLTGLTRLAADDEWRTAMPAARRLLVTGAHRAPAASLRLPAGHRRRIARARVRRGSDRAAAAAVEGRSQHPVGP